jgi:hypothetical protein
MADGRTRSALGTEWRKLRIALVGARYADIGTTNLFEGSIARWMDREDAADIVRMVNAHDDLVSALREARDALNGAPNTVGLHSYIDAALAAAHKEAVQ